KAPGRASPLLRLYHQKIGVAELVMLIPERRLFPHRGAQVKDRYDRLAGNAERHDHGRMMMAYRDDVAPRLINGAVNDAFGIKQRFGRSHWLGIERELQNVLGFDQQRRARQQIAVGMRRMTHAHMAESIENAFMREDAIGERQFLDRRNHPIEQISPPAAPAVAISRAD